MDNVKIFSLRNYEIIEKHEIELDVELTEIGWQTIVSLLKSVRKLPGKAFIIVINGESYYATKIGDSYNVFDLTHG